MAGFKEKIEAEQKRQGKCKAMRKVYNKWNSPKIIASNDLILENSFNIKKKTKWSCQQIVFKVHPVIL